MILREEKRISGHDGWTCGCCLGSGLYWSACEMVVVRGRYLNILTVLRSRIACGDHVLDLRL